MKYTKLLAISSKLTATVNSYKKLHQKSFKNSVTFVKEFILTKGSEEIPMVNTIPPWK